MREHKALRRRSDLFAAGAEVTERQDRLQQDLLQQDEPRRIAGSRPASGRAVATKSESKSATVTMPSRERRHGVRHVTPCALAEQAMLAVGGGHRLEILLALRFGPRHVSAIAQDLLLDIRTVSRELATLERCGLVRATRDKTHRPYETTDRVQFAAQARRVRLAILTARGESVQIEVDDDDAASPGGVGSPATAAPPGIAALSGVAGSPETAGSSSESVSRGAAS